MLPITNGELDLGPWEQVFYAEFDGQRKKRVVVKVMGGSASASARSKCVRSAKFGARVRMRSECGGHSREFPAAPVVGVGGVVVQDGKALIVKRAHEPRKGEWSLPGGRVELGESLEDAARREIKEETGLDVDVGPLVEVFDRVHRLDGRVRYHFVIVDYLCTSRRRRRCAPETMRRTWRG